SLPLLFTPVYALSYTFSLFLMLRPPPRPTLFPYTTLFRSSQKSQFSPSGTGVLGSAGDLGLAPMRVSMVWILPRRPARTSSAARSEEHTSELQSLTNLVCRLLLEKKNTTDHNRPTDLSSSN